MPLEKIVERLRSLFQNFEYIHTVILYGSVAENRMSPSSDIDIAIAAINPLSPEEMAYLHEMIERELCRRVDVRNLDRLKGIILSQILRHGKVIIRKDPAYLERRTLEMIEFRQDMLPIIMDGLKKRLEKYSHA